MSNQAANQLNQVTPRSSVFDPNERSLTDSEIEKIELIQKTANDLFGLFKMETKTSQERFFAIARTKVEEAVLVAIHAVKQ